MQLGEGVEWGLHCCLLLTWLKDEGPISATRMAEFHDLPAPYLTKQMQAIVRAGIARSTRGPKGGYELARPADQITLIDVVEAIEGGKTKLFACTEIRQQGAGTDASRSCFTLPCAINAAMSEAESQWRAALRSQTLADIAATVQSNVPGADEAANVWLLNQSMTK